MNDAFGKRLEVGATAIHFYAVNGSAHVMKCMIAGFTPKRVRIRAIRNGEVMETIMFSQPEKLVMAPFEDQN